MATYAEEELERVRREYAAMTPGDLALWIGALIALAVVGQFRHVSWSFFVATLAGAAIWEVTKYRLRRDAAAFARASLSA